MTDNVYQKFVERWEEVTDLPPQTVGPLTPAYKRVVKRLKVMPWPLLVVSSLFMVIGLYLLFGSAITSLTTVLQRAF